MSIGFTEIILILVVVLLLFGAKRLPELARSVGKALSEFKRGVSDATSGIGDAGDAGASRSFSGEKGSERQSGSFPSESGSQHDDEPKQG